VAVHNTQIRNKTQKGVILFWEECIVFTLKYTVIIILHVNSRFMPLPYSIFANFLTVS